MPPINVLIKPASSACNMGCTYCFYRDIAENRDTYFEGMISIETMEHVIKQVFEYAEHMCTFTFQGGEPTLRGIEFYKQVIDKVNEYNTQNIKVQYNIQTNGTLINDEWAKLFVENNFLVGLSLDGTAENHNLNRKFNDGKNTWNNVMKTVDIFNKYKVEYNILCVITGKNAKNISKIYNFYKKHNFKWLQFIPCLEPIGSERGDAKYALSVKDYGDFLIKLFDLWFEDLKKGNYVSIRYFDNLIHMLKGRPPEICSMNGKCSIQFVIEGDGAVYPCDFYVLDEWKLGNIKEDTLADMITSEIAENFVKSSCELPNDCKECNFLFICRNGCRRDRYTNSLNFYCEAYKNFLKNRLEQLASYSKYLM